MGDGNLELIRGVYDAFGRGDIPEVLGIMSDDIDWHVPADLPHGMDAHGPDEVGGFFQQLADKWDGLVLVVEDMVAADDRVVALTNLHGKFAGIETGYRAAHVWTIQEGKAVRFDEYVDVPRELLDLAAR
jgi:ketosteroid isomerase-like protein